MTPDDSTANAPATGSTDPDATEITPDTEPNASGTLFLMLVLLIIIGAVWVVMYRLLLQR
jgi:hypothetical protein